MNIFDEIQHRLASKTRIRALFKDVHVEDIERIISRLEGILAEKKDAVAADEAKRQAKQENIDEVRRLLAERGLSLDDLDPTEEAAPKKRRNVQKFTFQYETNSGDTVTWHGSTTGRLPKDFQTYLDRTGKKRLDCVIED
ncbi:H-NS family nucleoid-associated regulatory protein [Kistimonas scapharcae]|uniref:H-NS family nucleoid-associated regulatory protein n=1 Tax=Kistimonas scapharcae TaxID=1036133 RepID=A0ABP8UYX4_9GAMM